MYKLFFLAQSSCEKFSCSRIGKINAVLYRTLNPVENLFEPPSSEWEDEKDILTGSWNGFNFLPVGSKWDDKKSYLRVLFNYGRLAYAGVVMISILGINLGIPLTFRTVIPM